MTRDLSPGAADRLGTLLGEAAGLDVPTDGDDLALVFEFLTANPGVDLESGEVAGELTLPDDERDRTRLATLLRRHDDVDVLQRVAVADDPEAAVRRVLDAHDVAVGDGSATGAGDDHGPDAPADEGEWSGSGGDGPPDGTDSDRAEPWVLDWVDEDTVDVGDLGPAGTEVALLLGVAIAAAGLVVALVNGLDVSGGSSVVPAVSFQPPSDAVMGFGTATLTLPVATVAGFLYPRTADELASEYPSEMTMVANVVAALVAYAGAVALIVLTLLAETVGVMLAGHLVTGLVAFGIVAGLVVGAGALLVRNDLAVGLAMLPGVVVGVGLLFLLGVPTYVGVLVGGTVGKRVWA